MIVSIREAKKDTLIREKGEELSEFSKNVIRYKSLVDADAEEFSKKMCIEGLSIRDVVSLYADLQRSENVRIFKSFVGKSGKMIRFPLWKEEAS